jgi:AcrR family transcriptional regulator
MAVKTPRPYRSPRRAAQADATRGAILDAAQRAFAEQGYGATTMQSIAAAATVSVKTVYAIFGNKRRLLSAVLDRAIAGDDQPVPIIDRPWVQAMRDEPVPRDRLRILAREGAAILARRADVDELIRRAAATDPDIAALGAAGVRDRRAGQAALLRIALGPAGVDEMSIDTVFAIGSPEVFRLLVTDRGWSSDEFATWYDHTLARLLLPDE